MGQIKLSEEGPTHPLPPPSSGPSSPGGTPVKTLLTEEMSLLRPRGQRRINLPFRDLQRERKEREERLGRG